MEHQVCSPEPGKRNKAGAEKQSNASCHHEKCRPRQTRDFASCSARAHLCTAPAAWRWLPGRSAAPGAPPAASCRACAVLPRHLGCHVALGRRLRRAARPTSGGGRGAGAEAAWCTAAGWAAAGTVAEWLCRSWASVGRRPTSRRSPAWLLCDRLFPAFRVSQITHRRVQGVAGVLQGRVWAGRRRRFPPGDCHQPPPVLFACFHSQTRCQQPCTPRARSQRTQPRGPCGQGQGRAAGGWCRL